MERVNTTRAGEWAVLTSHFPGRSAKSVGILLADAAQDRLFVRLRPGWWSGLPFADGAELWSSLEDDIREQADEMGAAHYLDWLETHCSHALKISSRRSILFQDSAAALESLYNQEIEPRHWRLDRLLQRPLDSAAAIWDYVASLGQVFSSRPRVLSVDVGVLGSALAVLCVALAIAFWDRPKPASTPAIPIRADAVNQLQLPPLNPYSTIPILNLESAESAFSSENSHSKAHRLSSRSRKRFQYTRLATPSHRFNAARIDATPPKIDLEIASATSVPVPIALPSAPKYRSKNRFVRALGILAAPFKAPPPTTDANKIAPTSALRN